MSPFLSRSKRSKIHDTSVTYWYLRQQMIWYTREGEAVSLFRTNSKFVTSKEDSGGSRSCVGGRAGNVKFFMCSIFTGGEGACIHGNPPETLLKKSLNTFTWYELTGYSHARCLKLCFTLSFKRRSSQCSDSGYLSKKIYECLFTIVKHRKLFSIMEAKHIMQLKEHSRT